MTTLSSGLAIEENVVLKPLTSWLVGGPADFFAQPKNLDQLIECYTWGLLQKLPITILGGGTNVLISDRGVRGLTIALRKFSNLQSRETVGSKGERRLEIECLSGTSKSELLKTFLKSKLEPALFLAGLPGDVGGGVVMNAGVGEMITPREFVELTDWIEVLRPDGMTIDRLASSQLVWSYRHCEGWRPGVVVRVGLSWPLDPKDDVLARVKQANLVRMSKQPLDMPSCGSVFVNPPGHKSGQLVESSGLKGFSVGGAKVSEKHANFIVNFNDAKASDIHGVIEHVKTEVLRLKGVQLKTEVVYLGEW
ncbi:MAG: UDP-N-acetylmuramate dehydrogenase [Bdellovibrionota bacterium]